MATKADARERADGFRPFADRSARLIAISEADVRTLVVAALPHGNSPVSIARDLADLKVDCREIVMLPVDGLPMPMPAEYARASQDFDRFMEDLRLRLEHDTRHQSYQTLESAFRVFRKRLDLADAVRFGGALPAVLRAVFLADYKPTETPLAFAPLVDLNREVRERRIDHDFSPPDAIERVAEVLGRHVDVLAFQTMLAELPPQASVVWANRSAMSA